jgi:hypothetical protein
LPIKPKRHILISQGSEPRSPQVACPGFEKKAYNYSDWTKGKFSEVVTVSNPARHVFLGGIGSESEENGKILHPGDFYGHQSRIYPTLAI